MCGLTPGADLWRAENTWKVTEFHGKDRTGDALCYSDVCME